MFFFFNLSRECVNDKRMFFLVLFCLIACYKYNATTERKLFTIHYKLFTKNRVSGLCIRDVEGGEAGTEWSEAEWSTGAKRTPEQARRRAKRAGMPKRSL